MSRPEDRCDHVYEPDANLYKPYCCWREAWKGGKCVWHAAVWQKPAKLLQPSRVAGTASGPDDSEDRWVGRGGERLDGAVLREADLKRMQFRRCTLFGADLSEADLRGVDCSEADMRHANLSGVHAQQSVLEGCTFREADLSGADLKGANLSGADLRATDLSGANLVEADLSGADLRRANLEGADLQGADLPGANGYEANVSNAAVVDAELQGANFEAATLTGLHAMRAEFRDAKLPGVDASEANFENADLSGAVLTGADFTDARLGNADLTESHAAGTTFVRADLESARMSRADCYDADFTGAMLHGVVPGGLQVNEGTTFDERVVYDPDDDGEVATDGGESVDDLAKAAGTYRILEVIARENELPRRQTNYDLRRRDVRRKRHRENGDWAAWLRSAVANVTTRYGEEPGRVVAAGLAVVLGFGLVYPLRMIEGSSGELLTYAGGDTLGVLQESLYFSAVTFATGSTAATPVGVGRILAATEGFLGVLVFALLVYSFARRATR